MVAVFFGENVVVHVAGGVANDFPYTFRSQFKDHVIGGVVEEACRAFQFDHAVAAQGQLFGRFQQAVFIGIECRGFGGGIAGIRVRHLQQCFCAVRFDLIDLECGIGNLDRFAGFCIDLDELQVPFQFLVQHVVGQVGIAGGSYTAIRLAHDTLRRGGVHRDHKRVGLEQVLGQCRFHDEVLAIRQAGDANNAFLIGEQFRQAVLVGILRRHPAVALAVRIVLCGGQAGVVFFYQSLVGFVHPGNRRAFAGEIILQGVVVVAVLAVGVENGLHIVGAVCIFLEFIHSRALRDKSQTR